VLRHEVGVLAKPIARSLDLDDNGMVKQPIEQRGGDYGIAKNLTPFGKAAVGCQDHGTALIAGIDQLEEQIAAAGTDRQISDLVDRRSKEVDHLVPFDELELGQCESPVAIERGLEREVEPGAANAAM
jgi:hypothetical protein